MRRQIKYEYNPVIFSGRALRVIRAKSRFNKSHGMKAYRKDSSVRVKDYAELENSVQGAFC